MSVSGRSAVKPSHGISWKDWQRWGQHSIRSLYTNYLNRASLSSCKLVLNTLQHFSYYHIPGNFTPSTSTNSWKWISELLVWGSGQAAVGLFMWGAVTLKAKRHSVCFSRSYFACKWSVVASYGASRPKHDVCHQNRSNELWKTDCSGLAVKSRWNSM